TLKSSVAMNEGVTECSRSYFRAYRMQRIGAGAATVNMLAEMARIEIETSKLPGSRDWRELDRLVAIGKGFAPAEPRDERGEGSARGKAGSGGGGSRWARASTSMA